MNTINQRIIVFVFVVVSSVACAPPPSATPPMATVVRTTNTVVPTSTSTKTATLIREPTETPQRILARPIPSKPRATTTPANPALDIIEGYWIQNTTADGLCSNSPRILGPGFPSDNLYLGDDHSAICYLGSRSLEYWPYEYGSGGPGAFPTWYTKKVPQMGHITGAADLHASTPEWAAYGMPSFVGAQGKCVLESEGDYPDVKGKWQCFTEAEGLPFNDIRGYGVAGSVYKSTVEWFMSDDSIASRGLSPQDQVYSIPELIGVTHARPTCLSAPYFPEDGVWVGTNGYGVIHINPEKEAVTRYTTADGLSDNSIRYIEPCGKHCVWVGTENGIAQWDGATWRQYTTRDGLPDSVVFGIGNDWGGDGAGTWIVTASGPAFLKLGADRWHSFPDFPPDFKVTGVAGNVFTTKGDGLLKFQRGLIARGQTTSITDRDGLPDNRITALAQTASGILVGTSRGAAEWDGKQWIQVTRESVKDVSTTLIATNFGLWVWNGNVWTKVSTEQVSLVAENGWFATPRQVCQWVDGKLICPATSDGQALWGAKTLYVDPVSREVFALDGNNNPWKYEAGANHFVAGTDSKWFPDSLPDTVHDMVAHSSEWQYATDVGVYFVPFDSEEGFTGVPNPDYSLAGGWPVQVRRMSLDTTTDVTWLATNQGVFYSDREHRWGYVAGLPSRNITTVLATRDAIWFGTADKGLIRFVPSVF